MISTLSNWLKGIFAGTKREVVERGTATQAMYSRSTGMEIPNSEFKREFVVYKETNLHTGSERLVKEYLD